MRDIYSWLGMVLVPLGVGLMAISYFMLGSIPLTALGISCTILGIVSLLLSRAKEKLTPEASLLLFEVGFENISSLIEDMGISSRAFYLPSHLCGGEPKALLPLRAKSSLNPLIPLQRGLIVKYGEGEEDIGLLITTPGSKCLSFLEAPPGENIDDIEIALNLIIVGGLNLASGVRVSREGEGIRIELQNPSLQWRRTKATEILGTPLASITASVVAEALKKPILIEREEGNMIHLKPV